MPIPKKRLTEQDLDLNLIISNWKIASMATKTIWMPNSTNTTQVSPMANPTFTASTYPVTTILQQPCKVSFVSLKTVLYYMKFKFNPQETLFYAIVPDNRIWHITVVSLLDTVQEIAKKITFTCSQLDWRMDMVENYCQCHVEGENPHSNFPE